MQNWMSTVQESFKSTLIFLEYVANPWLFLSWLRTFPVTQQIVASM